jgi:hypothetical protein
MMEIVITVIAQQTVTAVIFNVQTVRFLVQLIVLIAMLRDGYKQTVTVLVHITVILLKFHLIVIAHVIALAVVNIKYLNYILKGLK